MATFHIVILAAMIILVQCQRPSFAGTKPIGFPELPAKPTTTVDPLGNRFGEGGTTERLPLEANGDRDLIDRISKFPIDQQPFWYLNWKALEEQRKNPQTYPQRPSQFAETPNTNTANANSGALNSNAGTNTNAVAVKSGSVNSGVPKSNAVLGNRNGGITTNHSSGNQKQLNTEFHSHQNNMSGLGHS